MIPSPAGCLAITATSPAPDTVYVMLVSNPLCENRHTSALAKPLVGCISTTGFPVSAHELLAVENAPNAAAFKSRLFPGTEIPAVVGSTTTMSFPLATGAPLVSAIDSSPAFGAATTSDTTLELVPSALRTCTLTFPAAATSLAFTGAVHSPAELHVVVRSVPPITSAAPGPGLLAANPLPSTRSVNPFAAPAYTLAGCSAAIFAPVEIVTFAAPDCVVSSELTATTFSVLGPG